MKVISQFYRRIKMNESCLCSLASQSPSRREAPNAALQRRAIPLNLYLKLLLTQRSTESAASLCSMPLSEARAFCKSDQHHNKRSRAASARKSTPSTIFTLQLSPAHQTALIGSFIATMKSNEKS